MLWIGPLQLLPSFQCISIGLPVDCEHTLRAYLVVLGIKPKDLNMPNQLPVAVIKLCQKLGGSKGFIWLIPPSHNPLLRAVRADAEEEIMEQCYSLACAHLAYITQTHLPRDGATHSGLSLPSHFAQSISDNLLLT